MSIPQTDVRVLVVDDDAVALKLLHGYLHAAGYQVFTANDGAEALKILQETGARIVVSDWYMPNLNGLGLCRQIRARDDLGFIYFVLITQYHNLPLLTEAFDAGVNDLISKPFCEGELLARVRAGRWMVGLQQRLEETVQEVRRVNSELMIANERLSDISITDELTGLYNRRFAMRRLLEHWALARRSNLPLSCIMMDIDNFKSINDHHGHICGDRVLRQVADIFRRDCRVSDIVARLGGDEFLVILPNQRRTEAIELAERLRRAVETQTFGDGAVVEHLSISLGIAEDAPQVTAAEDLIAVADRALYQCKSLGRNNVCVGESEIAAI
jgi:two-component system, cell cycle response regulator